MVKNSKKPKSHLQPPMLPQRPPNKCPTTKTSNKSEKVKATTTVTRGLPKSKAQLLQVPHSNVDTPSTSKQAVILGTSSAVRPKSPTKSPWGGIWKRTDKKKDLTMFGTRKHTRPRKRSPIPEPSPVSSPRSLDSSPTEDNCEDAELNLLLQSGIIRYADVVRSKNVSSSASLKPPPPPPMPIRNVPSEAAAGIDLEYFPELGQHKTCQNTNLVPNGNLPRRTTSSGSEEKTTVLNVPDNPDSETNRNETVREEAIANETTNQNNRNESSEEPNPTCTQCLLNAQWLERVIQNSGKPYCINIPEFNFIQPDIPYPRFLMQFEDENYLKAENMALLGLKLALGGNFQRHHTNCQ